MPFLYIAACVSEIKSDQRAPDSCQHAAAYASRFSSGFDQSEPQAIDWGF
jgi:hypothetical protein